MVQRVAATARRLDEHAQVLARRLLADEIVQAPRAERRIDILGAAGGGQQAVGVGHASFRSAQVRRRKGK